MTKTIHVKDGLSFKLELLDVLARERMTQLLADELAKRGFEDDGEGVFVKQLDDISVEVNPETGEVVVRITAEDVVNKSVDREFRVYDENSDTERLKQKTRKELDREVDEEQAALQRKITERLEGQLGDIRAELDKVSTRVVAEGLKQRARELGEIEEISEDEETGNMVIRVRV